jgi:hypothetical protein
MGGLDQANDRATDVISEQHAGEAVRRHHVDIRKRRFVNAAGKPVQVDLAHWNLRGRDAAKQLDLATRPPRPETYRNLVRFR